MSNSTDSPDLKRTTKKPNAIDHVKTGFSATQKILTLIGTVLSVIVACITISNATSKKSDTPKSSTAVTTVIKEKDVSKPAKSVTNTAKSVTNTDTSTPASSSHISHSTYESKDSSVSSSYSESSSQPSSSVVESSSSESIPSSSVEQSQPESTVTDSSSN